MKKLMLALGTLSLLFSLGCGKNKECVEACEKAEKTSKEACAKMEGPAKEACDKNIITKDKCSEACK